MVALGVKRGPSISSRSVQGGPVMMSVLMKAGGAGQKENIKILLAAKADFKLINSNGETAGVLAGRNKKSETLEVLRKAGAHEYTGDKLPEPNPYSSGLAGKDQRDISGGLFKALPFLTKDLRFFVVYEPIKYENVKPGSDHHQRIKPGKMYAVLPSMEVLPIHRPKDFKKLKLNIKAAPNALAMVKILSSPTSAGWPLEIVEIPFTDFPSASSCLSIEPSPIKFGITDAKAVIIKPDFQVTRYGLLKGQNEVPNGIIDGRVVRVTETVGVDGSYSLRTEPLKTPGLTIRPTCFER